MININIAAPGQHKLPPLPYPHDALEPVISSATMHFHHDIHHKTYVDDLNKTELKLVEVREKKNYDNIKLLEDNLAFNGSGHILHSIYWTILTPPRKTNLPSDNFISIINASFGSMNSFKEQFINAALKTEGSGWAVLVWIPAFNMLDILQTEKHQNIITYGGIPILVIDVWEHAYYLDYQNRRADYLKAVWKIINWKQVEKRFEEALEGKVSLITRR